MNSSGYSPAQLLNPKAAAKMIASKNRPSPPNSYSSQMYSSPLAENGQRSSHAPNGQASLIENLHGVKDRTGYPAVRKRKLQDVIDLENRNDQPPTSYRGGRGGDLGEMIKQGRKEGAKEAGPLRASAEAYVISDDETPAGSSRDDDELEITSENIMNKGNYKAHKDPNQEICIGKLADAKVQAHKVPNPKMGMIGNQHSWPAMKTELHRLPGASNHVIAVTDPMNKDFGNIDARTARALAPLMDSANSSKIRWVSRLNMRNKKPYEFPGQAVSAMYDISIVLYAKRSYAVGIGKLFSQQGIFLRDPMGIIDRNVPYDNPQAPKDFSPAAARAPVATTSRYTTGGSSVVRTAEQVRTDVLGIMDSLIKSSNIPEKDPVRAVRTPLLPHQKQALYFMTEREKDKTNDTSVQNESSLWKHQIGKNGAPSWYNIITGHETRKKPDPVLGGILADVMGLGKTLSVLSLVVDSLNEAHAFEESPPPKPVFHDDVGESELKFNSRATLLICPLSTVSNWEEQIARHLKSKSLSFMIYHGPKRPNDAEDLTDYDLIITTYSTVTADKEKRSRTRPHNPLTEINWFRIVLDEGHLIREATTKQSKAICSLSAQRRWAVTGTPVQNRLSDLGALFKFLRIRPFDEPRNFAQYIEAPFKQADAEILSHLRVLVDSITLRRLKDKLNLPPRTEEIMRLQFTSDEKRLYNRFRKDSDQRTQALLQNDKIGGHAYAHILRAITRMRLICAHGQDMLSEDDYNLAKGYSTNNPIDLENEGSKKPDMTPRQAYDMFRMLQDANMNQCSKCLKQIMPPESPESTEYDLDDDEEDDDKPFGFLTPCNHLVCQDCRRDFMKDFKSVAGPDGYGRCGVCESYSNMALFVMRPSSFRADEATKREVMANPRLAKHQGRYSGPHTKVRTLLEYLDGDAQWSEEHPQEPRIKSVVFSGWTQYLDLIQIALTDKEITFTRLDGQMSRANRKIAIDSFMNEPEVECILVSLHAGGLGLNLTAASRVYVMEPQFNPAAEAQAIERVHRLGQTREVKIFRFIMDKSFEEGMLRLQERKKNLASMSMDKQKAGEDKDAVSQRMKDLRTLFK